MSELGRRIAQALQPLAGVRVAWFFGSRAKGTHRPDSDLDLLVVYDRSLDAGEREQLRRAIVYELAGALGQVGEAVDIADADEADSAVAFKALAEGELVLARSEPERVHAQVAVWRRYDDDAPRRAYFRAAAKAAAERMDHDRR